MGRPIELPELSSFPFALILPTDGSPEADVRAIRQAMQAPA
jgi:hypothetical protein